MTNQTETASTPRTEIPSPAFDPMTPWTASQETFHKMMTEAVTRAQAFGTEYAALEAQLIARAQGAIASWAQLAQDAIAYSAQLSAQARKVGLETAKSVGVMRKPRARA